MEAAYSSDIPTHLFRWLSGKLTRRSLAQAGGRMAATTLFPGSVITESGLYLVSHSTRHRPNTATALYRGLLLPQCSAPECRVSYSLVTGAAPPKKKRAEILRAA